jgi:hypothetical protein
MLVLGVAVALVAPVPVVEVAFWSAVLLVAGAVEAALDDAGAEEDVDEVEDWLLMSVALVDGVATGVVDEEAGLVVL